MLGYHRADRLPTSPPGNAPVVRFNPHAARTIHLTPMIAAPPRRPLPLLPDRYHPGPVDLSALDTQPWHRLDCASSSQDLPHLVRRLITAPDADWRDFWTELIPAVVHQGTCDSATPAMASVLAALAISPSLPATRRVDLHLAVLHIADQVATDLINDADLAALDGRAPRAQSWAVRAHAAAGATIPAALAYWPQEPPAIQFTLAGLAALYPDHGAALAVGVDALSVEYAGTRPGSYLELAAALLHADDDAADTIAGEITRWDEDAHPGWLSAPGLPARVTCGHLLAQAAARIATADR